LHRSLEQVLGLGIRPLERTNNRAIKAVGIASRAEAWDGVCADSEGEGIRQTSTWNPTTDFASCYRLAKFS